MRFISHLDLSRLFKRAIRKAQIRIGFSNGFNPHELVNIVQPLSLGYEGISEYFEIDTICKYDSEELIEALNTSMPEGIRFYACKEIPAVSSNMSGRCEYALYETVLPFCEVITSDSLRTFLDQKVITIIKKDKKTKKPVEKDIKAYILNCSGPEITEGSITIEMTLRCASNETLNPGKLLESFMRYLSVDIGTEYYKIIRKDILGKSSEGKLVSLYEIA